MPETIGILAPSGRDSAVVADILRKASIGCFECADGQQLIKLLDERRAGVMIVAEEAFRRSELDALCNGSRTSRPGRTSRSCF